MLIVMTRTRDKEKGRKSDYDDALPFPINSNNDGLLPDEDANNFFAASSLFMAETRWQYLLISQCPRKQISSADHTTLTEVGMIDPLAKAFVDQEFQQYALIDKR